MTRGPRVMVLGPPSSGKTTVVKNLVNMALGTGMGWSVGVAGLLHVIQSLSADKSGRFFNFKGEELPW